MTYPDTKLPVVVQIAPGADLSADPSTWTWTDVTAAVMIEKQIVITEGRGDWGDQVDASTCELTFLNTSGDFAEHNPLGQWYGLLGRGTPLRVRINDVDLFGGYVPAWVPRWDMSGKKRIVPVVARGVLERLQPSSGTPPTRSPLRREFGAATDLLAYWPCEDDADSTTAASALTGGAPMVPGGTVTFAAMDISDSLAGSVRFGTMPLPSLVDGGSLTGLVPAGTSSPAAWAVAAFLFNNPGGTSSDMVMLRWETTGGTYVRWELMLARGGVDGTYLVAYDSVGAATVVWSVGTTFVGPAEQIITATQNGANIDTHYLFDDLDYSASTAGTLGRVTSVTVNPNLIAYTAPNELVVGHVRVFDIASVTPVPIVDMLLGTGYWVWGTRGHRNELAHHRLARLCAEDGVALTVPTIDLADGVAMSSQPDGTPAELYRECELADGGILAERPFGLAYTPRSTLYNQPVALTLDASDLGAPPEADGTDQHYRNRMVVKRFGGSSATAETSDIATSIVRDESVDLRLYSDGVLPDHAAWRLHLSTHEGLRWPRLVINLAAVPQHIAAWLSCQVGSRIVVTNPPADVAGQDIDVLLEGRTTTLDYKDWIVEANLSPAAPWLVGIWATDRYDTARCELAATYVAGTDTSISITTTSGSPWRDGSSSPVFPMDWDIAGARVRVTAITGTGTSQTATCQAATVNGVNKSIPSGAAVSLWSPARYAL